MIATPPTLAAMTITTVKPMDLPLGEVETSSETPAVAELDADAVLVSVTFEPDTRVVSMPTRVAAA